MVRIGFLSIAHLHASSYGRALKKLPQAELVGIYDPDQKRGRAGAKTMQTKYFSQAEALLEKVDGVIVCSENSRHRDFTELAAAHGKDVLCEKPIATTLEDAQAMITACQEGGVRLQIAFPVRFNTPVRRLKEIVDAGAIGDILAIRGTNRGRMPGGWFVDPQLSGGGAVLDHTVHVVDLLRWFLNREFTSAYAEIDSLLYNLGIDDCGLLSLEMEGGIFVTQDPSWSRPATFPTWGDVTLKMVGSAGQLYLDAFAQNFLVYNDQENKVMEQSFAEDMDLGLIQDFVEMVASGRQASISGYDGLQALKVALAAYESARVKRPVAIS
ncbi:MAG: Gfo/Idh/MocA family oxidoreductase [Firmicutes bacterium]|nr:Gfo/Idh/MocA family oxidoreductase [Bacillota bacterium]